MIILRLILIAISAYAWRAGGSDDFPKGVRRYGIPGVILINLLFTQNWLGLISIPFLALAFSLGYGVNSKLRKLLKSKYLVRLICGLAYSLASTAILWGNWWLLGFHLIVCSVGVMLAGNQKFQFEDKREEAFIGLLVSWIPLFA
jgi:hypothetical protein